MAFAFKAKLLCIQDKSNCALSQKFLNAQVHLTARKLRNLTRKMTPIDAFVINIQQDGELHGIFVISKAEAIEEGLLRSDDCCGRLALCLYPPFVTPGKGFEQRQKNS
eukprot:GEMP01071087.1.p2 GENE.GEMP01071087.1~~GEMP01071087.1.p2  ORF type:complete len:108 (+),score=10.75 GEMP01071087.1:476-799(+)